MLRSREYAGSARWLRGKKVFQAIDEEIRRQVGQRSGLAAAVSEDPSKRAWRDIWGPRFD
jgi:hypothetical protein